MIIKCETCGSVYCIADKFIDSSERRVKCSKCNNIWAIKSSNSLLSQSNLSESIEQRSLWSFLANFLWIWLILMNLFLFPKFWSEAPFLSKIYQYLGYSSNFKLDNLNFNLEKGTIFINGHLTNISTYQQELPLIRYRLLDRDRKILFQHTNEKTDIKLAPGEKYIINSKIINLSEDDAYLILDYGNKIELTLNK